MKKVLILGGYGNFGKLIAYRLVDFNINIIIAGRNKKKAKKLATKLNVESAVFDINVDLKSQLKILKPFIVINTCGPFQNSNYFVGKMCIENKIHYIDLADGRDYVCGIFRLDELAKKNKVLCVSGASTVPCLSSAVIEKYKDNFSEINSIIYGISPGQKTPRGLATVKAILSYVGKPIHSLHGHKIKYGWQDIYIQKYPILGNRWMANCDIPDLDLFPQKFGIKSIKFSAGMENIILHFGIWILSWVKRFGFSVNFENYAPSFLKLSNLFNVFGTSNGGMHIIIDGKDLLGKSLRKKWFIVAKHGDGPQIPCVPSSLLAKKLIDGNLNVTGAIPCLSLISLDEYIDGLKKFNVEVFNL